MTPSSNADLRGAPKRQYQAPRLRVYGDARVVTENVVSSGMGDGSPGGTLKT